MRIATSPSGFTLVELAIVITIIGVLTAGVLKGQELVRQAQIKRTIKTIYELGAAHQAFVDQYGQHAGDMATATRRLMGCTGNGTELNQATGWCRNGDGNGVVGESLGFYACDLDGDGMANEKCSDEGATQTGSISMPAVETTMYWRHLGAAELITGVTEADPVTEVGWGVTHPMVPWRGGLTVFWSHDSGDYGQGLNYRWSLRATQTIGGTTVTDYAVVSPHDAETIDRKMDDGLPNSGFVAADYGGFPLDEWCDTAGTYNGHRNLTCLMVFSVAGL